MSITTTIHSFVFAVVNEAGFDFWLIILAVGIFIVLIVLIVTIYSSCRRKQQEGTYPGKHGKYFPDNALQVVFLQIMHSVPWVSSPITGINISVSLVGITCHIRLGSADKQCRLGEKKHLDLHVHFILEIGFKNILF